MGIVVVVAVAVCSCRLALVERTKAELRRADKLGRLRSSPERQAKASYYCCLTSCSKTLTLIWLDADGFADFAPDREDLT